jgi:hypothetical protein
MGDDYVYGAARRALRAERDRLERDANALVAEAERLKGSTDAEALKAHSERLRQHRSRVRDYRNALGRFHAQAGDGMSHDASEFSPNGLESAKSFLSERSRLKKSASCPADTRSRCGYASFGRGF